VQRWAHGKLPRGSRGDFDTKDLVQEAALRMLKRRSLFEPRHAHSVQAYLRRTVMNLVRDEARRLARRPESVDLGDELPCDQTGPLEITIQRELRARYEEALRGMRPKDRNLIVASVQEERHVSEIARIFNLPSPAAARMAVTRAINRLMRKLNGMK
jgi:RNA polymerase sigma-70 factor (ECF subfamily)